MTDVYDKLLACEQAEKKGHAYPFFPEIWGEARQELERLREALREIAEGDRPDNDEQFCVGYWGATARAALGEGKE